MTLKPVYDSLTDRHNNLSRMAELWRYRDFIWNLISRDLKVRYKRSTIGFLWTMLNPLLTMGTLVIVFSTLFRSAVDHYPTYILSGILVWNMFAQGTVAAMNSLLGNSSSLRKTYIPAAVFVISGVGSALMNFFFALVPLILFALIDGIFPSFNWFYVIVVLCQLTILTLGLGFIVAAVVVFYADVLEIYQVLLNLLFFFTPVMYPISILSPELQILEHFNPLFHIVTNLRAAFIARSVPPLDSLIIGTLTAILLFIVGWIVFTRAEEKFAYYV
jgi:ABC-type polysaccharide/polyol phosphate export permease